MAVTRLRSSGIKSQGVLKYDSALGGLPGLMPAPTAADPGTGTTATVSFTAISGATSYTAISSPGNFTGTATSSPVTVSGLTEGVAYTFQIRGNNAEGNGPYSAASNSITPVAYWALISSNYIGNNYSANYGFASSANVDGSGTVRWHRVNPQSSSSGYHDVWNGSSWVAKAIFNTSPGREIFGYGGSPNNSGTFVIAGGQATGSSTALDAFYYYYMTNNAWQYVGTLPGARRFVGTLVTGGYTTTNNNFLLGGVGTSNGSSTQVFNNNWRLAPAGGGWTTRTSHPLNYEWSPYSPHTRGVEGDVSTYRVHTLGGYSAPGGTYATQTSTLGHYGYQNSSDTWTTYTSFPGSVPGNTSTARNAGNTADVIYSWDWGSSPNTLYTWNGSTWTAQSLYSPPTGTSITSYEVGSFIDSTQKVTMNKNFVGIYQINKVA